MTNNANSPLLSGDELHQQARTFFQDATIWVQTHWLNILIATAVAVTVFFALHMVRRWGMKLCERGQGVQNWYSIIGRALAKTGHFFILMLSIKLVTSYANPPVMVATTITFLFTISAVFQAAIWVRELIFGAIEHKTSAENYHGSGLTSALGIIRILITVVLFAIALIVVLSNLGVNVTGLVAGLGVGGIAIGLAAQGIFANLFAALTILFDRPFRVGDKIRFDRSSGTVVAIGLMSTRIRSFVGEELIIANKQLLDKLIENLSLRHHTRIKLPIGVAYETPIEKLEALPAMMKEIVEAAGGTLSRASTEAFGASSIDFMIEYDVPGDDMPHAQIVRDKIMFGIVRRFAAEGITIPYPTQTAYTAAPDGTLIPPYPLDPAPEAARP
ncbi:mechanosensitive ion channel family protein [Sphingomonas sp. G-3-2-10]|uniref:mechanosensitive ion channel family protein n=1 Tax=Sphingomonas sp. G-3-2-10 TaxID=2728838 RepID=UPI00146C6646|nr:mechanosensitive ion channel family protein [Sphingomonas sp. G-3-2-10]NML06014.1 mechanosensitive ion channel family protein [Sphingomonas sp. G-3-2-10]